MGPVLKAWENWAMYRAMGVPPRTGQQPRLGRMLGKSPFPGRRTALGRVPGDGASPPLGVYEAGQARPSLVVGMAT